MKIRKTAEKLDFEYSKICQKADEAELIAEERGIDLEDTTIVPHFDMNGPIVDKQTVDYGIHEGVREAMQFLDNFSDVRLSMLSGWDVNTLQFVADERLDLEMDHVGELGSQAVIDGEYVSTVPDADQEDIIDFRRGMWLSAGADGLTLNEQGNISPVTGCTYIEGHRKGLFENHPVARNSLAAFTPESFYRSLMDRGAPEEEISLGDQDTRASGHQRAARGDYIAIDLESDKAAEALSETLTHDYPLMGFEYEVTGDREIRITANTEDSVEMTDDNLLNYFQRFMEGVASDTPFELEHNPDLSTDFQHSEIDVSKEHGANYRTQELGIEDYMLFNIGDKPGDMLEGENAVPFAQEGYPAEGFVEEQSIPHVKAENAGEYALAIAELMRRYR